MLEGVNAREAGVHRSTPIPYSRNVVPPRDSWDLASRISTKHQRSCLPSRRLHLCCGKASLRRISSCFTPARSLLVHNFAAAAAGTATALQTMEEERCPDLATRPPGNRWEPSKKAGIPALFTANQHLLWGITPDWSLSSISPCTWGGHFRG